MYDMNDLFNSRDVVGCKLNQIIGSHKYTKSNVYKDVGDTPFHYDLSALLVEAIDHIIDICKIDSEAFASKLNTATIIFSNGRIQHLSLSYDVSDSLATAVQQIYEMGELLDNSIVTIEACDEVETLINFKNISMIQLPLTKIECDIKSSLSETDDA